MAQHADAVWRVCALYFPEEADRQDAFQDAFMSYALADAVAFEDEGHRKAWLITVARNRCLDMLKASARKNLPLSEGMEACLASTDPAAQPGSAASEVLDALRALDDPPRTPLYLALYEGYTVPEIARMVGAPDNTVYSWIARGKRRLKEMLR